MKKILFLFLLYVPSIMSGQSYRFLKLETLSCSNHKWQEIEWISGGIAYPQPKLTSNTSNGMTASGSGSESYRPYDGNPETHAWIGYIDPPLVHEISLDLGAGNEIDPEELRITKPTYSLFSHIRVWASREGTNWELLLDSSGISSNGFDRMSFILSEIPDLNPPAIPQNIVLLSRTTTSLNIAWDASSDDREVSLYEVYVDGILAGTSPTVSFLIEGLEEAREYTIYIRAVDGAGNKSANSDSRYFTTKTTDLIPPGDPAGLSLDSAACNKLFFSWEASSDNDEMGGYIIYLDEKNAGISQGTSFILAGLKGNTEYQLRIRARDASGNMSAGFTQAVFRTADCAKDRMPIGTNFWNISWGGAENDPFTTGYQAVAGDNPWKQVFLDETSIYSHFRFMDYMEINGSEMNEWKDRKLKTSPLQRPMAFEWMIDLCNRQGADLWICIPHLVVSADGMEGGKNHFVRKLAILVKTGIDMLDADLDQPEFEHLDMLTPAELISLGGVKTSLPLKAGLKFYIEYSNETWNFGFTQAEYCRQQGVLLGLGGDQYTQGRKFHAWAAVRIFEAVEDVYGEGNPNIVRMDAYQAVVPSQISEHYSVYKSTLYNPRSIFPDAFSPAPYFGHGVDGGSPDAVQELISGESGIKARTLNLKQARNILNDELKKGFPVNKLIAYESGQHVLTNAHIISRKSDMYGLYIEYLDSMNQYLDEMSHYVHCGTFSSGGAWGSKEKIGQSMELSHKYRALYEWINKTETRPDTDGPTAPGMLFASEISDTSYLLSWWRSVDNDRVESYKVYVNGKLIAETADTFWIVTGLKPGRNYLNRLQAVDPSGNLSEYSDGLNVTTTGIASFDVTFMVMISENNPQPVSGAEVEFATETGTTGEDGKVIFSGMSPGQVPWKITAQSFQSREGWVDIVNDDLYVEVFLGPGLGTEFNNRGIKIYPNPSDGFLRIESDFTLKGLSVISPDGKVMFMQSESSGIKELDLSFLPPGTYLLRLQTMDGEELYFSFFRKQN